MENAISDDYLYLGVEALDDEHRQMMEVMNELLEAYHACADSAVIDGAASSLLNATETHFRNEEEHMAALNYGALDSHRIEHGALIESLRVVLDAVQKDRGYNLGEEVIGLLRAWLVDHILSADKVFATFLKTVA